MATLEQIYELRDRLEQATGPDRKLDTSFENAFGLGRWDKGPWVHGEGHVCEKRMEATPYTGDLQAVSGLHNRLLPGWEWSLVGLDDGTFDACLSGPGIGWGDEFTASTAPLAWLRAIVAALIAQKENE